MQSSTVSVIIDQPFDDVYGFLADPMNFPSWGPVVGVDIQYLQGNDWLLQMERGPQVIRFTEPNLYGVLDYSIAGAGQRDAMRVPVRLLHCGEGSELTLIWRRRPGVDDAQFGIEVNAVHGYLTRLKSLLEVA